MIITTEFTMTMGYTIRILRVYIDGPYHNMGDNEGMINNCSITYNTLKKKHKDIV